MKRLASIVALVALVLAVGCGVKETHDPLIGTWSGWTSSQLGPCYQKYTFKTDGSYSYGARILAVPFIKPNAPTGTYTVVNNLIITVSESRTNQMEYRFDGRSLVLKESRFKEYTLKRK